MRIACFSGAIETARDLRDLRQKKFLPINSDPATV
jgi:hypothetical protein